MNEMNHKIYRSDFDKVIAGVASGLAENYEMDITIVRLLFVLSTVFLAGLGLIVYIVIWCVAPVNRFPKSSSINQSKFQKFNETTSESTTVGFKPNFQTFNSPTMNSAKNPVFIPKNNFSFRSKSTSRLIFGIILIVIGLNLLFDEFEIFNIFDHLHKWWPLILIGIGVLILIKQKERNQPMQNFMNNESAQNPDVKTSESIEKNISEVENQNKEN